MSHEAQPCQTQGSVHGGTTFHSGPSLQVWLSQPDLEKKTPKMETAIRDHPTHPPLLSHVLPSCVFQVKTQEFPGPDRLPWSPFQKGGCTTLRAVS